MWVWQGGLVATSMSGKIRLECDPIIVLRRLSTCVSKQRTCEQHWARVELLVEAAVGERSRPGVLIRNAVKIVVLIKTSTDRKQSHRAEKGSTKAEIVIEPGWIAGRSRSARPSLRLDRAAVFEMSKFGRKRDVKAVSDPGQAGVFTRGGVHRMEVGGQVVGGR